MNRTSAGVRTLQYIALVGFILFLGFPLIWLVSASIKSSQELAALDMSLLPRELHWDNYVVALQKQGILRSAFNSLVVALLTMVLVVALSIPASYALARFKGRMRAVGVGWILVSQVFPVILIIIPLFVILRNAHLVDTLVGLVLVYTTFTMPFALWMLQGFVAAIPNELEEAAAMDGAGRFQTLRRIVFPLLMPGIVATAMFAFVAAWNEFFFALVLIQSPENYTLPVALKMFVGGEGKVALGPLAAGAVLATIPSLIVFSILQRRLTGGLLTGSVKG